MDMVTLADAPAHDPDRIVARPFLDGEKGNVRVIRLRPGQFLPPHTHSDSDLMLYAAAGDGVLDPDDAPSPSPTALSPITTAKRSYE